MVESLSFYNLSNLFSFSNVQQCHTFILQFIAFLIKYWNLYNYISNAKMFLIIFMQISLFAYSKIWQSTILHQNVMLYSIIFMCKMVYIDERICSNYHIKNPQKSVLVKYENMQISGWKSRILHFYFIYIS